MSDPIRHFREVRTCRKPGCARNARGTSIWCHMHLKEIVYSQVRLSDAVQALEDLAGAAHALLWDWESCQRRGQRRMTHDAELARRLRHATRRAEDVLSPVIPG